ncbi:MAG TPA: PQQ-binding-like beta-propeller repeat protein [Acidimicrobiales bacterium]
MDERQRGRRRAAGCIGACLLLTSLVAGTAVGAAAAATVQADGSAPWPAYGFDVTHTSVNKAATTVSPADAAALGQVWNFATPPPPAGRPGVGFDGSPVVAGGLVFVGSNTGMFYALSEDTGAVAWSLDAGFVPKGTCVKHGIENTATVASDPVTGRSTVYVASANGILWALDAASGTVDWHSSVFPLSSSSGPFIWSSPTVTGGRVFIGISSECDSPLVRGGLSSFDQATGSHLATFWTVPSGSVGGSIWTSAAVSTAGVFVTTGNGNEVKPTTQGLSNSVVRLNPATLKPVAHWTVPGIATVDDDFGSSPTLFAAVLQGKRTPMVGACDKNGVFYAWAQTALAKGPVWSIALGAPATPADACLASATWNGSHLLITANRSTVDGITYPAVSRELDPATGAVIWQTGLDDGPVFGTSAVDGSGVLAAASYSFASPSTSNDLVLVNAANGALLATYPTTSPTGGGPVWADGYLLFAGSDGVVHAYAPAPSVSKGSPSHGPRRGAPASP